MDYIFAIVLIVDLENISCWGRVVEYCRGIIAEHKLLLPLLVSLLVVVVLYLSLLLLYFSYSKGDFGVMTGRRKINFLRFHSIFNCSSSFFRGLLSLSISRTYVYSKG